MANQLITKHTPSPWRVGEESYNTIVKLKVPTDNISQIYAELEMVAGQLQRYSTKIPRLDDVLDLFPETLRRLEHIKDDLEDIQADRPFRHEDAFRQARR
jgi:hypothetical protein